MADKKNSLHKTVLILLLVFIPPFWLLFTEEGSRVSDTALLWLLGKDEIKISLPDLDNRFAIDDIRTIYADNDWQCGRQPTDFGDALCSAEIGTFNGFPSQVATFYFRSDRLGALKVIYRVPYHDQIIGHVIAAFGQPSNVAEALAAAPDADNILRWDLDSGVLLVKKRLEAQDEPALLWLATRPAQ